MDGKPTKILSRTDYTTGCICPMSVELAPVLALLDEVHEPLPTNRRQNVYTLGEIAGHNVVVAVMPEIGNNAAATFATQLQNDFPSIKFGFLIGIGGGIPGDGDERDVRLGDVVVSHATGSSGGVIQYDLGKKLSDGTFLRIGQLAKPPSVLSASVQTLRAKHECVGNQISHHITAMFERFPNMASKFSRPSAEQDRLFLSSYSHVGGTGCRDCDAVYAIPRVVRPSNDVVIHYGVIGSANMVVKNTTIRDQLGRENICCLEMEAAGFQQDFPCLVIRGICDYADSHKHKEWQPYAAAAAAAYLKELLTILPIQQMPMATPALSTRSTTIDSVLSETDYSSALQCAESGNTKLKTDSGRLLPGMAKQLLFQEDGPLGMLGGLNNQVSSSQTRGLNVVQQVAPQLADQFTSSYYNSFRHYDYRKAIEQIIKFRYPGTGDWMLNNQTYRLWAGLRDRAVLWLQGSAGSGKTVLLSRAIEDLEEATVEDACGDQVLLFSIYDRYHNSSCSSMLCVILHQLLTKFPKLRLTAYTLDSSFRPQQQIYRPPVQLWWLLKELLRVGSFTKIYFIFDGIDALSENSRAELLSGFHEPPENSHCLIGSRDDFVSDSSKERILKNIGMKRFRISLDTDVLTGIRRDRHLIIQHKIATSKTLNHVPPSLKNVILERQSSSTYPNLLATCLFLQKVAVMQRKSPQDLQQQLNHLPIQRDALHRYLFDNLRQAPSEDLRLILRHLISGFKSFTIFELVHASRALDPFDTATTLDRLRETIEKCSPLIQLRAGSGRVQFFHPYIRDFILSYLDTLPLEEPLRSIKLDSHPIIAMECLTQVIASVSMKWPESWQNDYIGRLESIIDSCLLLRYSLRHWYEHLQLACRQSYLPNQLMARLENLIEKLSQIWSDDGLNASQVRHLLVIDEGVAYLGNVLLRNKFELCCALGLTVFVQRILSQKLAMTNISRSNARLQTALALSIKGGHTHTAKMLVEHFNVTSLDGDAYDGIIEHTVRHGTPDLVRMLLDMRKQSPEEISKAGQAVFAAANLEILQTLRESNVFSNHSMTGSTVLHAEFTYGRKELESRAYNAADDQRNIRALVARIQFLVQTQHIDINAKEQVHGNTALHMACWYNYPHAVIDALIKLGADVTARNKFTWTPLHLAARYAGLTVVKELIKVGGKPLLGSLTRGGNSALHWVAESRRNYDKEEVTKAFLIAGLDHRLENKRGETPLSLGGPLLISPLLESIPSLPQIQHNTDSDLEVLPQLSINISNLHSSFPEYESEPSAT